MRYVMQVKGHLDPFWQAWFENLMITREGRPRMYVSIRIQGHLDQNWQEWLEGLQIVHEADGTSRLFGSLQEQSALQALWQPEAAWAHPLLVMSANSEALQQAIGMGVSHMLEKPFDLEALLAQVATNLT